MIARLTGVVDEVTVDGAVIDVHGVGYLVFAPRRTLDRLSPGQPASLAIETQVREDHIHLFGFLDGEERAWFKRLTTVQGVGSRVALNILSVADAGTLTLAIAAQDKAALVRADGVGPKLAGRIVAELKDRVGATLAAPTPGPVSATATATTTAPAATPTAALRDDAVSALVNLGYDRSEAFGAVTQTQSALGADATVDQVIRDALKGLAR